MIWSNTQTRSSGWNATQEKYEEPTSKGRAEYATFLAFYQHTDTQNHIIVSIHFSR